MRKILKTLANKAKVATPEVAPLSSYNKALGRPTPAKPPIDPKDLSGGMANRLTSFREVMIEGRFICLERAR